MVSDWNCLKYLCMFCTVIIRCTETFDHPVYIYMYIYIYLFILKLFLFKFRPEHVSVYPDLPSRPMFLHLHLVLTRQCTCSVIYITQTAGDFRRQNPKEAAPTVLVRVSYLDVLYWLKNRTPYIETPFVHPPVPLWPSINDLTVCWIFIKFGNPASVSLVKKKKKASATVTLCARTNFYQHFQYFLTEMG
jgi:hypothetical protein